MASYCFHGFYVWIQRIYPLQILKSGSSATTWINQPFLNLPPDQTGGQGGPLVGRQGEVSQVDGDTLVVMAPGSDQASPDVIQHRHKCCPSHNEGSIGDISVRLGDRESQGGSEHLHPHEHPHHEPCDGLVDQTEILPWILCPCQAGHPSTIWPSWSGGRSTSSSSGGSRCWSSTRRWT